MGKKLSFYFIFSFFLVPFKVFGKNVDRWSRVFFWNFFMFSFFVVSFRCLTESVDRWTSSEHSEKKNQPHLCFIQKCGLADKKLSFNFLFLFYLAPFKIMSKSVNRSKGQFLYYVRVFWGFFELPTHLCKDIFTSQSKGKLPFFGPPTHPYVLN